jgi:hypothetical protein
MHFTIRRDTFWPEALYLGTFFGARMPFRLDYKGPIGTGGVGLWEGEVETIAPDLPTPWEFYDNAFCDFPIIFALPGDPLTVNIQTQCINGDNDGNWSVRALITNNRTSRTNILASAYFPGPSHNFKGCEKISQFSIYNGSCGSTFQPIEWDTQQV